MARPRVRLAMCAAEPGVDPHDAPLVAALTDDGVDVSTAAWDDQSAGWGEADLVVLRGTWDYPQRLNQFLAWADGVAAATTLLNRPEVLRWNTDKRYLADLAAAGAPVVPTSFLAPGEPVVLPEAPEVVVKPTVSAGSRDTARYTLATHADAARDHAAALLADGRTVMVQPYLDGVDAAGETALLFLDGRFSHAIRKGPLLQPDATPTDQLYAPEEIRRREPSDAEHAVAAQVLAALPAWAGDLLYARVDLLPTAEGPVLLELELVEPSLFLDYDEDAGRRLADAVLARLG